MAKVDLIAFPSHDWGHRVGVGSDVRHAALLDSLVEDSNVNRLLWVRRIHPKRVGGAVKMNSDFIRVPLVALPFGLICRVTRFNGKKPNNFLCLEHYLPHALNKIVLQYVKLATRIFKNPVLWIGDPKETWCIEQLGEKKSIFDAMDDWSLAPEFQDKKKKIIIGYINAMKADVITTNTEAVARKFSHHSQVEIIPNAGYPAKRRSEKDIEKYADLEGKLIGLVGRFTNDRLNKRLVKRTLSETSDAKLIVAGKFVGMNDFAKWLINHERTLFLGEVKHKVIMDLFGSLDALIVPHVMSEYTLSQDSIKVYQALHYGIPVVSTPVEPSKTFKNLVYVAKNMEDWSTKLHRALEESADIRTKRKAVMFDHTWKKRHELLLDIILS